MKQVKVVLSVLACAGVFMVALLGINVLQARGEYQGESVSSILGKDPAQATLEDCMRLPKKQYLQLFYAADSPTINDLKGEYSAVVHSGGILAPVSTFYMDHFFGPGKWVGKAFEAIDGQKGQGYNLFEKKSDNGRTIMLRARKIDTYVGKSNYDDKMSYHLDYSANNTGMIHSMHDELRKINDRLFVGLGALDATGGKSNPVGFVIHGAPREWVGCCEAAK